MGLTPEQIEACVLLVAWLSVNLILNMLCKWELSPEEKGGLGLSFPFFQSALDQVITLLVVGVFLKCKPEHNTLSWAQFMEFKLRLLLFSVLGCTCIVMNNASLITVGLSVNQLLKCTSPLPVMLLSFIILQTKYAYKEIACVTLIVASAILAVPMGEWKSSTAGILMIFGSVLTAAVRNVLAALLMTNAREKGLTPFVLVFYNAAYSVLPLICLWLGIERRKSLEFVADNPGYYVSVMAGISLLATMYNFLSFATTKATSALTFTIAGTIKQVSMIVVGMIFVDHTTGLLPWVGTMLFTLSLIWYTKINLDARQKKADDDKKASVGVEDKGAGGAPTETTPLSKS